MSRRKGQKYPKSATVRANAVRRARRIAKGLPVDVQHRKQRMPRGLVGRAFGMADQGKMINDSVGSIHQAMVQAWVGPRGPDMSRREPGRPRGKHFNPFRRKR